MTETTKTKKMKIALVGSHGGHLTELLYLLEAFAPEDEFFILTYDNERTRALPYRKYLIANIGYNYLLMAIAFVRIFFIWLRERPQVIISTGAEVAIPAFYVGKLFGAYCIFIELWAAVNKPTQTGRWLYGIADEFYVQWESLLASYGPKARYRGTII
jgi:UDP-N-acetylglucosamine:LPS N-acetylglucosamine transferase